MQFNVNQTRNYLQESEFEPLFVEELGWEYHTQAFSVTVDDTKYALAAIAEKRGMVVFRCTATDGKPMPNYATRRAIQRQVAKSVHEHVIIYTDAAKTTQVWQWVRREQGRPEACREHRYHHEQAGDALLQKLQTLAFSLEEEEGVSIVDVTGRVRAAFDVTPVTKRFYERFKKEHEAFLQFLNGIPDIETQESYVSVMLNRLMFIYFIQKKGFLNGDTDYLRTNLNRSQTEGTDRFYQEFLCPLFFEGFAKPKPERTAAINQRLGEVPYLNGGIFQHHRIEQQHGETLHIPDKAFDRLFTFFEQYQWHLDERPLRNDNEINPDVLGYIFEKYVNERQKMGAYYTPEDITKYISQNTIIPFLFDAAREACKIAFEGDATVWQLLQTDPGRYIYDAVKKGVKQPLPPKIAIGIDDVSKRTAWNTRASAEYTLPTEIWREVVARRQRYERVHAKLVNGEITDINALITENLDIQQFAQDVIETCEGPDLLRAFWHAITQVTVLDPTCGSGAFLFAALNILEPLYDACLERMQAFIDEADASSRRDLPGSMRTDLPNGSGSGDPELQSRRDLPVSTFSGRRDLPVSNSPPHARYTDFRDILARTAQHPSPRYFILKSIVINNLYGVDIMDEAAEICKLRLFLKMVAQIDDVNQIEPLPDIDFNVQAGNTLVGYTTLNEVEKAVTGQFDFDDTMARIRERAEDVDALFSLFRQQQTELGGDVTLDDKQALQGKLAALSDELNGYLAGEYGVETNNVEAFQQWLSSHQPFHWFIAFYGILDKGGFDVIIGNPPYVEYSKVKKDYTIRGYETESCGNLYAFSTERSLRLLNNSSSFGLIVPMSLVCNQRMETLQEITRSSKSVWLSNFSERPSKLFVGAEVLLTILLSRSDRKAEQILATTGLTKWTSEERKGLFHNIAYHSGADKINPHVIPKLRSNAESRILEKLSSQTGYLRNHLLKHSENSIYYRTSGGRYWKVFTDFPPVFKVNGKSEPSTAEKLLSVKAPEILKPIIAVLSSNLFWWWYTITTDSRNLPVYAIQDFPVPQSALEDPELARLGEVYLADLRRNSEMKVREQKSKGKTETQTFKIQKSKPIIDEIDRVLAEHYGFTDEELDFIINYDIKYRMGLGG